MEPLLLALGLRVVRPAVRRRALDALALKGAAAIKPLENYIRKEADAGAKALAVWSLTRIATPEARSARPGTRSIASLTRLNRSI